MTSTTKVDLGRTKLDLGLLLFFTALGLIGTVFIMPAFYNHKDFWDVGNITIFFIHLAVLVLTIISGIFCYIRTLDYIELKHKLPAEYHGDDRIEG